MAWALQFDGVNDKATFATWSASGDFTLSGAFTYVNSTEIVIGDNTKASEFIACISGGVVRARVGNANVSLTGFTAGDVINYTLTRVGLLTNNVTLTIGGSSSTISENDAFTLNVFGAYNSDSLNYSGQLRGVHTLSRVGDIRTYDMDASSHSAGTVVITDTTGGDNATGVNMPTDGSAWVDLGGSGISIAVDSGTYSQTGTTTPINAQLSIITTAGSYVLTGSNINLTSAKKLITETGSYDLTGKDVTLIYTPGGGGEALVVDSGVYSLAGDEVLLRADLSIIANSDDYSITGTNTPIKYNASIITGSGVYSFVGADLNLFGNYGMIAVSNSYSLTGTSVTLKYSGDTNQVIGTVTAGFAPDLYSAGYKPNTITVTFKE